MDWLLRAGAHRARPGAGGRLEGALVLYDRTSVDLEGRAARGPGAASRDGKKGKPQIEVGLLLRRDGRRWLRAGSPAMPPTRPRGRADREVRARFGLARVVLVGDGGSDRGAHPPE